MKAFWPASLRARLMLLVVICTLPPMALVTYTAFERYNTSIAYGYYVSRLTNDAVISRYDNLVSRSRDVLSILAALPAVNEPEQECRNELRAFLAQMPIYTSFDVLSASGQIVCSTSTLNIPIDLGDRKWFEQVVATKQFVGGVVAKGRILHVGLLIFSMPRFAKDGNFIGTVDAVASPSVLLPPTDETNLERDADITVFTFDGTALLHYPNGEKLTGTNQSKSELFKAVSSATHADKRLLPGLDGRMRLYRSRYIRTDVPATGLYIASGITRSRLENQAFMPLLRDLMVIAAIALFIIICTWWFSTSFVGRRIQPLLDTLQRIGAGEWHARTGLGALNGEMGVIAQGVDGMAEHLESRISALYAAEQAREISEQRYVELVEQAADGNIVRHVNGELVFVNDALCQMLGYRRDELLKLRFTHIVDDSNLWRQRLQIGESLRFEAWMRHHEGHDIPVEVSVKRLKNGDIQSIQHDISERLKARQELENSERHYRALVENSMLGILLRRPSGEIIFCNQALCNMCGYSRNELMKMKISALVEPEDSHSIERVQNLGVNETASFQSRLRHKGGRIIYVDVNAHRLDTLNIQVVINDVSERVKAEQLFAEERNFVFQAIETLPGIFYVFNAKGHFLRWNRQMEQITGYTAEDMQRINSSDILPPERRVNHWKIVAEILQGNGVEGETELYCKDGRRIPYFFVARGFTWRGQECVVGMGVDMTERNRAEQLAMKYLNEMQQLSARILDAQEDERRGLARELHDELGQGLTATLLSLKNLEEKVGTQTLVAQVKHASGIITDLTQQVRALSLSLRPSVLDDLGLVAAIRWYIRERVETAGLKVILNIDRNIPRMAAMRETACFRVLQGVLTNVLRHAKAKSVQVTLHQADGKLVLDIEDDGRGFDVDAARQAAVDGKSLGLLGIEERVRLVGGTFEIISKPGKGAHAHIEMPMA